MDILDALWQRRSVRRFTEEPVSEQHISTLLHAAMSGPSACNMRPWEFYVVTNEEKLALLRKASRFSNIKSPLAIVATGNLARSLPLKFSEYWIQDVSAAVENILLAATGLGLGAVWCGLHPQKGAAENAREALSIPEKEVPMALIFIGHPAESPEPRDQYDEKRVHFVR